MAASSATPAPVIPPPMTRTSNGSAVSVATASARGSTSCEATVTGRDVRRVRPGALALPGARDGGRAAALDAGRRARRRRRPPALRARARGPADRPGPARRWPTGRRRSRSTPTARSCPTARRRSRCSPARRREVVALGRPAARSTRSSARSAARSTSCATSSATRGVIVADRRSPRRAARSPGINVQLALELPRAAAGPAASSRSATACGCGSSPPARDGPGIEARVVEAGRIVLGEPVTLS